MTRRSQMLDALSIGPLWVPRTDGRQLPLDGIAEAQAGQAPSTVDTHPLLPRSAENPAGDANRGVHGSQENQGNQSALHEAAARLAETPGRHSDAEIAAMDWDALQVAVSNCTRCRLCETRNRTVFGVGDPKAQWLFVGEGPGRNEDLQGEPFVGPAGKLLDNMLAAMSLRRGRNAFIANVVKCRPTDAAGKDRAPAADEVAACKPYLSRQIALLQPSLMVALGKTAAVALLECEPSTAVSALRGKVHRYGELPLVVTYHPAYLLRALTDKRKTWEDLCLAMETQAGAGAG